MAIRNTIARAYFVAATPTRTIGYRMAGFSSQEQRTNEPALKASLMAGLNGASDKEKQMIGAIRLEEFATMARKANAVVQFRGLLPAAIRRASNKAADAITSEIESTLKLLGGRAACIEVVNKYTF